jgi:hypothetical protein
MSYANGKTLISTAEGGLFEPSPNDEIAVAPGISDMINRPQSAAVVQDNSSVVNAIASLNDTMKGVKDGVGQLYTKKSDIKFNVDSQNFGTAQIMGTYTLA